MLALPSRDREGAVSLWKRDVEQRAHGPLVSFEPKLGRANAKDVRGHLQHGHG